MERQQPHVASTIAVSFALCTVLTLFVMLLLGPPFFKYVWRPFRLRLLFAELRRLAPDREQMEVRRLPLPTKRALHIKAPLDPDEEVDLTYEFLAFRENRR